MQNCANGRCFGKKTSLCIMFLMTSSFFVAEIVVGYITNSTALVADSFHMLSDVLSLIIGFLAVFYSKRTSKYNTYGWARAEVLGALANAVFLLALCFTIVVSAIQRLVEIEEIENPLLVLYVGAGGLLINILGLVLFHGHTHTHDHGHDYEELDHEDASSDPAPETNENEKPAGKRGSQMNMKGVFLHILGDALGSVVVIVSALTIQFAEGGWRFYIDPVMSLVIALIIICTTWPLLKRSGLILLQHPPAHVGPEDILAKLLEIDGINNVHEFHLWQLSGSKIIVSAHITMHKKENFKYAVKEASKIFHEKGVHSFTLQPEYYECDEGQSICGEITCPYLSETEAGSPIFKRSSSSDEMFRTIRHSNGDSSSCLHPCVSAKCQAYQCCSANWDRKSSHSSDKEKGHQNVFFVEVDIPADEQNSRL